MRYVLGTHLLGTVVDTDAVCTCCREKMVSRTVWVQTGVSRKGVAAHSVNILRSEDKVVVLYSGDKQLGVMPNLRGKVPSLSEAAAALGGRWVMVRRDVMVRPEEITHFWPDTHGARILCAGTYIDATRKYWPLAKQFLDAPRSC